MVMLHYLTFLLFIEDRCQNIDVIHRTIFYKATPVDIKKIIS